MSEKYDTNIKLSSKMTTQEREKEKRKNELKRTRFPFLERGNEQVRERGGMSKKD